MTKRVYRTAQGKIVDMGALQLRNESVRAVGNMGVNARGDLVDGNNRPIDSRNRQVANQYRRQTTNVVDRPVVAAAENQRRLKPNRNPKVRDKTEPATVFDDIDPASSVPEPSTAATTKPQPKSAEPEPETIAQAIARARQRSRQIQE